MGVVGGCLGPSARARGLGRRGMRSLRGRCGWQEKDRTGGPGQSLHCRTMGDTVVMMANPIMKHPIVAAKNADTKFGGLQ